MTTHLEIESLSHDNNKSLFRSQRVRINGKEAVTPLKALDPSKFRDKISLNTKAFGFAETYKNIKPEQIDLLSRNSYEHDRFSRMMINYSNKCQSTDLHVCVLKFTTESHNSFPSVKEIGFLTDVAHSFSDITPIPPLDVQIDGSNFPRYLEYLQSCYDTIEEANNKPIMGMLPKMPRELYPKLLNFYIEMLCRVTLLPSGSHTQPGRGGLPLFHDPYLKPCTPPAPVMPARPSLPSCCAPPP